MTEHRFTKTATDYASGTMKLVRTRLAEYKQKHGEAPLQMLLHPPTVRSLFNEFSIEHGIDQSHLPPVEKTQYGAFEGTPFAICHCGIPFAADLLISQQLHAEEL